MISSVRIQQEHIFTKWRPTTPYGKAEFELTEQITKRWEEPRKEDWERNREMMCYIIKVEIGYYFLQSTEHNECDSICTLQFSGYYIIYKFMCDKSCWCTVKIILEKDLTISILSLFILSFSCSKKCGLRFSAYKFSH